MSLLGTLSAPETVSAFAGIQLEMKDTARSYKNSEARNQVRRQLARPSHRRMLLLLMHTPSHREDYGYDEPGFRLCLGWECGLADGSLVSGLHSRRRGAPVELHSPGQVPEVWRRICLWPSAVAEAWLDEGWKQDDSLRESQYGHEGASARVVAGCAKVGAKN